MPHAHANGIDIYYEVHGAGYPLVLAHGFTTTLEMWRSQIGPFSQRYQLVLYDARGHGRTSSPKELDQYSMEIYADDQRALMEHLGIEQAYIGGLSMGAAITLEFAVKYPQMTRAAIVADASAAEPPWAVAAGLDAPQMLQNMRDYIERYGPELFAQLMLESEEGGFGPPRDPMRRQRRLEHWRNTKPEGFVGAFKAMRLRRDLNPYLSSLNMPILLIAGDEDPVVPAMRYMSELIPHNRAVLIANSPHGTAVRQPAAFNLAVLNFLEKIDKGQPFEGLYVVEGPKPQEGQSDSGDEDER